MNNRALHIAIVILFGAWLHAPSACAQAPAQQKYWIAFAANAATGNNAFCEECADALHNEGVAIVVRSRWFHAVSAFLTPEQKRRVAALPFVASVAPVRKFVKAPLEQAGFIPAAKTSLDYGLNYGDSRAQLEMINVPAVHDIWIDGTDIIVGMLDNGFAWRHHESLQSAKVLGEYDFINNDSLTENEPGDPWGQDSHGTLTMSALTGFKEGILVGPAYNASLYLGKTEVDGSETSIEEDYWVAGIEWLTAQNSSVVSVSLGYNDFDDTTGYTFANGDFDGKTALTSRAAARAAREGVVLVCAMGNEGNYTGSILAPADADSIISVGAVAYDNRLAGFSSIGPTNDGRIKPDVVAPGVGVVSAVKGIPDGYTRANGTSLSTPLAAGVAALVRSARPELTPLQVRDALRKTADNAANPDVRRGWGLVNAWNALLYHGMVISTNPKVFRTNGRCMVAAYVISPHTVRSDAVSIQYAMNDGSVTAAKMEFAQQSAGQSQGSGLYTFTMPEADSSTVVTYYITASDDRETRASPYAYNQKKHSFVYGNAGAGGRETDVAFDFALDPGYPNPLSPRSEPTAFIRYEIPREMAVRLKLYDALGREIATLAEGVKQTGSHIVRLNSRTLSSGVYFYRLDADGRSLVRRLAVVQ